MKKTVKKLIVSSFVLVLFTVGLLSCRKEINEPTYKQQKTISELANLQTSFAKILVSAMKSDEALRAFIKTESLKQFDNDNDILYQLVKDKPINGQETLRNKLLKFASIEELEKIERGLPLLTIFVPTLPNFSPETWNAVNEIPAIAIANLDEEGMVSLYKENQEIKLKSTEIPGFPVIVIKENERVRVKTNLDKRASNSSLGFNGGSVNSFEFIDEAFDGRVQQKEVSSVSLKPAKLVSIKGAVSRVAPASVELSSPGTIDQVNVDAYNSRSEWQRDYVYYGITPSSPNGKFRNNYSEFITSFKFLNGGDLNTIADQDGDPKANNAYKTRPGTIAGWGNTARTMWTDGRFEFRITVLINAKSGLGNDLTKMMSVNGAELFDLQYDKTIDNSFFGTVYQLKSVIPKEYRPNIELLPWDLENYGMAWKLIFHEIDNAQEVTNSYENTTTYAANFGIDATIGAHKIGPKFGLTATTSEKRTFTVKTTLTSDFLGEATLTFDQPVIIGTSGGNYITREITTGNNISISIEPKRTAN